MFKRAILFITIIGVVGICLNLIFGNGAITFLKPIRIENTDIWIYTFDLVEYKENINYSIGTINDLALVLPTKEWQNPYDLPSFFTAFGNNMAVILNYIILILSTLLYPLRLGAYLVTNILVILGLKIDNPTQNTEWLITFLQNLRSLQIPYIA